MPLPKPVPGLVIRYSYLWDSEYRQGREEGVKDCPCAMVMAVVDEAGDLIVTVLPVTHTPATNPAAAIAIPPDTKQRLGLDDQSSWIILTEANRFVWPGPDLRLGHSGDAASVAYGLLPRALFRMIRERLVRAIEARLVHVVARTQ